MPLLLLPVAVGDSRDTTDLIRSILAVLYYNGNEVMKPSTVQHIGESCGSLLG
jgi:hypothetical protein